MNEEGTRVRGGSVRPSVPPSRRPVYTEKSIAPSPRQMGFVLDLLDAIRTHRDIEYWRDRVARCTTQREMGEIIGKLAPLRRVVSEKHGEWNLRRMSGRRLRSGGGWA